MTYTQARQIVGHLQEDGSASVAVIIVDTWAPDERGDRLIDAHADIVIDARGGQFVLVKKR
jgi:hypothetical protein